MTCLKELALPEVLNFLPEPFWLTLLGRNDDDDDDDDMHRCAF